MSLKKIQYVKFIVFTVFLCCGILAFTQLKSPDGLRQEGLSIEEYQRRTSVTGKPVFVYFSADWCVPCIKLKPIIEQIEAEQKDKVVFLKLDVDENPLVSQHLEINTLPLFIIYRNGKKVWENNSFMDKSQLTAKIEQYK